MIIPIPSPLFSMKWRENSENRVQSQANLSYAEVHPVFAESRNPRFALKKQATPLIYHRQKLE